MSGHNRRRSVKGKKGGGGGVIPQQDKIIYWMEFLNSGGTVVQDSSGKVADTTLEGTGLSITNDGLYFAPGLNKWKGFYCTWGVASTFSIRLRQTMLQMILPTYDWIFYQGGTPRQLVLPHNSATGTTTIYQVNVHRDTGWSWPIDSTEHDCVYVIDAATSTAKLYVDGSLEATLTAFACIGVATMAKWTMGYASPQPNYNMEKVVRECIIWSGVALTAQEIAGM